LNRPNSHDTQAIDPQAQIMERLHQMPRRPPEMQRRKTKLRVLPSQRSRMPGTKFPPATDRTTLTVQYDLNFRFRVEEFQISGDQSLKRKSKKMGNSLP
jgi:hypothetical protein